MNARSLKDIALAKNTEAGHGPTSSYCQAALRYRPLPSQFHPLKIQQSHYFSLDYSDAAQTGLTMALNQALAGAAAANGAVVADAFTAFQQIAYARPFANGNTCRAALLNGSPQSALACDVHPSLSGQRLLAKTVAAAYRAAVKSRDD